MKLNTLLYYVTLPLLAIGCSDGSDDRQEAPAAGIPIEISSCYPVGLPQTRASLENGFVADDAVGIFVADYDEDGKAGTPTLKGDRAGNVRFVYDGVHWTASYQMYWKNSSTPADIYGYFPYDQGMQSVTDYAFSVSRRQDSDASASALAGYEASDLLWAKAERVMPTAETVSLHYRHLMAGVSIILNRGTGFEEDEWAALDKTVQLESTVLGGSVDLSTGTVTVSGDLTPAAITPLFHQGTWRAVVFPQKVDAGHPVISMTIDGKTCRLVKESDLNYLSGKMHRLSITVNKDDATGEYALSLAGNDVVAWIDDPSLHDGLVRQYTIVTLQKAGALKAEVDKVCDDYSLLRSLKIVGPMNSDDRQFIQDYLLALRDVNMAKVDMEDGYLDGFRDHGQLQHFVFPEKGILTIGDLAFYNCPLLGDLVIPEGVECIRWAAYMGCGMKGSLVLPSTLKRIEEAAFAFNGLTGELRLPEGIEYLDPEYYFCFQGCNFEGTLHLPESLTSICNMGFPKMTGTIVIPPAITEVGGFGGIGCTQVEFHDGVTAILGNAFVGSQLSGELVLPPNLKSIGGNAFAGTKITRVIFPDNLRTMSDGGYNFEGIFCDCAYLTGTLQLPRHVARIPSGCFRNCVGLTGLVIPEGVDIIDQLAFDGDYNLSSIVCEDEEPPVVREGAFRGVPKDNFTVEVPKGCVEKYREATGWSEFKRIAEYSNFVCRPMQANALNTAHTEQLTLNADGPWEVEHQPEWVTVAPKAGTGKAQLTLTFRQMAHGNGNRSDSIIFRMPVEGHRTFCAVSQYDYAQEEDSYLTLQQATKGNRGGIDIVFLGDGYDGEDIANGSYLTLVREQTEHFFGIEPYKSHRGYFNVYAAFPLSQEKGVNTMNTYVNNRFATLYGYDGLMCTSNQLMTDDDAVRQYAIDHTPLTQERMGSALIILVPNSDAYSGVTYYGWYTAPVSICPPSSQPYPQDTRGVVQHEAGGHGFGYLGDEEIMYSLWAPASIKNQIEEAQRRGWYANLATVGGLHSVPWSDFIFDQRYSDEVDVFEGGFGYMRGIFRPEQNSCMNYGIPYYNAPSRLSIMRRILNYAGEEFSMDYFYGHDSKEWGSTEGNSRMTRGAGRTHLPASSYAGSNQHHAPRLVESHSMSRSIDRIRQMTKNKKR